MKRPSLKRLLRSWGRRQLYSLFSSLGTLFHNKLGTLMTVLVLGIAMALPLGLYVTLENLQSFDLRKSEWGSLTAFLETSASEDQVNGLISRIEARGGSNVQVITPAEGMEEFSAASGFSTVSSVFDENPLPWETLLCHYDLQNGRYQAQGLNNEAKIDEFNVPLQRTQFTPEALRRLGRR